MSKKEKEEVRIEKIIRDLLKLPENRRCINCNSLGPQYVCTTFLTFVCTNCGGVHREFTHRVKSISLAKFSAEEVGALQAAGNERARQIYFKAWDPQRNSFPDGRLRDFIKHVYVDRKYAGERSEEKLPRVKLSDKEDSTESRKVVAYRAGSGSQKYEDRYEPSDRNPGRSDDRSFRCYYDERSPRYAQDSLRYGGLKKSPVRFEIVDDRVRDDGSRSRRQTDSFKLSHNDSRFASRSPDHRKNMNPSRSPVVYPVGDILGENGPPFRVGENSKSTDSNKTITSSQSKTSTDKNPMEQKTQNPESLIDLNTDSKPSDAAAAAQSQENHPSGYRGGKSPNTESFTKENVSPTPTPNILEFLLSELSFPTTVPASNVSDVLSNENPPAASGSDVLVSGGVTAALPPGQMTTFPNGVSASTSASGVEVPGGCVPSAAPEGQVLSLPNSSGASTTACGSNMIVGGSLPAAAKGQISASSDHVGASTTDPGDSPAGGISQGGPACQPLSLLDDTFEASTPPQTNNLQEQPASGGTPEAAPSFHDDSSFKVQNAQQGFSTEQHQLSSFPVGDGSSTGQQTTTIPAGAQPKQLWASFNGPNAQGHSSVFSEPPSQDVSKPSQDSYSGDDSQTPRAETKSGGRMELPADLFTTSFSPASGPIPGWRTGPPYALGYNMQYYPSTMPVMPYCNTAKSTNPFDLDSENSPVQAPPFPSMEDLKGALPNVTTPEILSHNSSSSNNSSGLMANQSAFPISAMPPQSHHFGAAMTSGPNVGQQVNMNIPPSRPQATSGVGSDGDPFASLNIIQQRGHSSPIVPNSLSSQGGNPFG